MSRWLESLAHDIGWLVIGVVFFGALGVVYSFIDDVVTPGVRRAYWDWSDRRQKAAAIAWGRTTEALPWVFRIVYVKTFMRWSGSEDLASAHHAWDTTTLREREVVAAEADEDDLVRARAAYETARKAGKDVWER